VKSHSPLSSPAPGHAQARPCGPQPKWPTIRRRPPRRSAIHFPYHPPRRTKAAMKGCDDERLFLADSVLHIVRGVNDYAARFEGHFGEWKGEGAGREGRRHSRLPENASTGLLSRPRSLRAAHGTPFQAITLGRNSSCCLGIDTAGAPSPGRTRGCRVPAASSTHLAKRRRSRGHLVSARRQRRTGWVPTTVRGTEPALRGVQGLGSGRKPPMRVILAPAAAPAPGHLASAGSRTSDGSR
jgi:hypothetical protein